MTNSRLKGKNGELDACRALSKVFPFPWQRTAQRYGKGKADVEAMVAWPIHVEVKRRKTGYTYVYKRLAKDLLITSGSLLICRLSKLVEVMHDGVVLPNVAPRCAGLEDAMLQARTDANCHWLPVVLARQDDEEWLLAWREEHDTRLMEEVRQWLGGNTTQA
jgi:hypothetical protein